MNGIIEFRANQSIPNSAVGAPRGTSAGSVLILKVENYLGGGRWRITIEGEGYNVTSNAKLAVGSTLRALVVRSLPELRLKIMPEAVPAQDALAEILKGVAAPDDLFSRRAIEAILRSGLPVTSETLRAVRGRLSLNQSPDPHLARFLALLHDKAIEVPLQLARELYEVLEGESGDSRASKRATASDASERRGVPRPEKNSPDETQIAQTGDAAGEQSLAESIRRALQSCLFNEREVEGRNGQLALANHVRGKHDSWVLVPFALRIDNEEMKGSLRLRVGNSGGPREWSVVVGGDTGHPRIGFHVRGTRPARLVIYLGGRPAKLRHSRAFRDLSENLRNMGIEVDDTVRDDAEFDGFSGERARGVDTVA